jgi:hypothetical protein
LVFEPQSNGCRYKQPDDIQTVEATVGAEYPVANQHHATLSAHVTQRVAIDLAQ